ncbi:Oxygen regulatory protein NreC [Emticicia aquatica]|jgi:DNA-binding NarL/FixJ family response regulator|uniref:Oxygen regulatory protein NreC n=1 Tax=Emticicia aquatica TaxID=1681835 RepID=A0ABN8ES11_9BACT|nr:response regulator transcription factor [Emticicia aquatica]CAH0995709.1 Oxygen regulatory protein NreC [Emticicia aquatica]
MFKLALVDDHDIFLKGLQKILEYEDDLKVVHSFKSGQEILNNISDLDIDILVLDVQLPDIQPEELLQALRSKLPNLPILYLTLLRGTRFFHKLQKFNIQGYILKDSPTEELIKAIKIVANGATYFSEKVEIAGFEDEYKNTVIYADQKVNDILSPREIEVLKLVCQEYSSADIAAKLFLSVGTVDTHRKNILIKLGVNNTVGLVKYALKNNIIT